MIFIANFTDIFIFKDKLTSVQLPSFFFLHRFRKGIKKSHQNSGIIMFVYFCFRKKCNMQQQRSIELWRCLQIVIYTEQQIQSLRECLHLYMKVIGPNDTSGITSLVVEVRGFILIGATLTS